MACAAEDAPGNCHFPSSSWPRRSSQFTQLLKIADLSFAVPATALSLVIETVLAGIVLRERVTSRRWAGAFLVTAGVFLISQ